MWGRRMPILQTARLVAQQLVAFTGLRLTQRRASSTDTDTPCFKRYQLAEALSRKTVSLLSSSCYYEGFCTSAMPDTLFCRCIAYRGRTFLGTSYPIPQSKTWFLINTSHHDAPLMTGCKNASWSAVLEVFFVQLIMTLCYIPNPLIVQSPATIGESDSHVRTRQLIDHRGTPLLNGLW